MGHVQVALNMYVWGMDIQEAIDFPRFFPRDGVCGLEEGVSDEVAAGLVERGHKVGRVTDPWGGGQGIVIDWESGMLTGGCDPRKDSLALGY
jgi:gamma-glutamyltranspeptidase/glutathione hydrolase